MRTRLRERYDAAELDELYPVPHNHTAWAEHITRVSYTLALIREYLEAHPCSSAADLSCGNGAILNALGIETKFFGDYAEGYAYQGPIELTIRQIPNVDMFICSETLEHLDNPDKVLAQLRVKAKHLVLSTPIDEADDNNPEHYWSWGTEDIEEMLETADWSKRSLSELRVTGHHYNYQIWLCS